MDATRLSLRYAALSDVGRVRKDNQDSGFASPNLLVIADGVGGAARGDIASSTAVQILRRLDEPAPEDTHQALAGAIHRVHDRLAELVEEDPELEGTSTTVTAAIFDGSKVTVGHVGDSRGYLLRDGTLAQLTKDHTFVQSLIDEGRITEEEAQTHPHKNLILRAVDGVHDTEPDLFDVELEAGDRIMLCSDGCSGALDSNRLADIMGTGSVDYAAVELVRAALEAGSNDNVTVVVADVVDASSAGAAATAEEDGETSAAATTGPMLVGAAVEQPRKPGMSAAKSFFLGHRSGDTGELEPVPGASDEDPEALRYAPRAPRPFLWLRRTALFVLVLGVLAAAGLTAYNWSQEQYYVAVADDRVAIYRGIKSDLPGLRLNHLAERTDIPIQSLPEFRAKQVKDGIPAESPQDAEEIVEFIRTDFARVCPTPEPSPSPSPSTSSATSSASPSGKNSPDGRDRDDRGSASPSPTPTPSPSPAPSPSPSPTLEPPECIEAAAATGGSS